MGNDRPLLFEDMKCSLSHKKNQSGVSKAAQGCVYWTQHNMNKILKRVKLLILSVRRCCPKESPVSRAF